ncbi:hypothetical protein CMUS01_00494 [Colletotrichum musicola]|uniref:Uncharacterized protein n=1 Tax=Colletotrichum musicola TaxID=2175873 RepID=A0A8H6NZ66_9PEZI|nr:hypothetical protein CMUS01_00494 [Colletotrichum musicola]
MRQVEARENLDVGTLSEQLRAAKRECAMWKARAEAAEKRVATLERFTRRLRAIQGGDGQYECDEASSLERDSREGAGIENEGVITPRLGETLHPTGVRKTSDGGAAAWWNECRLGRIEFQHIDMNGPAFVEVIEAVQELLEGDEVE